MLDFQIENTYVREFLFIKEFFNCNEDVDIFISIRNIQ